MKCSIHQPNYLPYLGLFQKINQSDIFVFYDTAQYTKGDYHNRNKIKGPNGEVLLSLPVSVSLGDKICNVGFQNNTLAKHLKTIEQSYKKAPYFSEFFPLCETLFSYNTSSLAEFNIHFIKSMVAWLGIKTQLISLSSLEFDDSLLSTDALIQICQLVGADEYLSGSGGRGYIEESKFYNAHIQLSYQEFHHPVYHQLWGDFIPYMSILDLVFNEGKKSIDFLQ